MSLKSEERAICGEIYRVTQLPVSKARPIFVLLLRVLGPSIAAIFRGIDVNAINAAKITKTVDALRASPKGLADAIEMLVTNVGDVDLAQLQAVFAASTQIVTTGKPGPLDAEIELHFAGRWDAYFKWIAFCVEVNYKSFFAVAASLRGADRPAETSPA